MIAPLAVRLKTSRSDVHVTKDVRGLQYGSSIPGGFQTATIELDRPLSLDAEEIQQYGTMYVYDGRSGETLWQGRLTDPGRGARADGQVWTVTAEGPAAHAKDRTVPLVYVDTNVEPYVVGPNTLKSLVMSKEEQANDNHALKILAYRGQVLAANDLGAWRYPEIERAGMKLARVSGKFICGTGGSDNLMRAIASGGGTDTAVSATCNTSQQTFSAVVVTNFTNGRTGFSLQYFRQNTGATVGSDVFWHLFYDVVARSMLFDASGSERTTGYTADTITANEIVNDLLGRLLPKFDGANASVATNSFNIDQLAYLDGTTAADVLDDLMLIHADHYWAAWEDTSNAKARFEWKAWPTSVQYEATTADGFDSPGSVSDLYNAVSVRWNDKAGRPRNNTRTQTVQALTDAGLTRTAYIDLGDEIGTSGLADRIGDQFLAEHATAPNKGTLTVRRPILDLTNGRTVQPWELRPGGLIRVRDVLPRVDALNATARDAVTVFKVVGAHYDSHTNSATLALDQQPRTVENLLARRRARRR